jgi:Rrf2 family protein
VRITHKVDYGIRVMVDLAEHHADAPNRPVTSAALAAREQLPPGFLGDVLRLLRTGGLVRSVRGGDGGWVLARPPEEITIADVIRVLDGALASVRGIRPHELPTTGAREPLVEMWVAVRAALRSILEHVTIADLARGELPPHIAAIARDPDAWDPHRIA